MRRIQIGIVVVVTVFATFGFPSHVMAQVVPDTLAHRAQIVSDVQPGQTIVQRVTLPWRANMVGVSFASSDPEAAGVEVSLRYRDPGRWSDWVELHVDTDEQPDRAEMADASPRVATLPQWVDLAKHFQIRVALEDDAAAVGDVRLETSNTNGDAVERPAIVRLVGAIGRLLTAVPATAPAHAFTTMPDIITRAEWGANESWRSSGPGIADALVMAHVHHTVNSNSYSRSESAALVRGIYRYHTRTRDYSDIGYNFLVDRYGQIFEGRKDSIYEPKIGGHAAGFNSGSTGIALIGTFTSSSPPSAMVTSLRRLLAWKLDYHHVPPTGKVLRISGGSSRYPEGKRVWVNRISGHRDTSSTACPGTRGYSILPGVRTWVNGYGHPKIYLQNVPPERVDIAGRSGPREFTVSATFTQTVDWAFRIENGAGEAVVSRSGRGTSVSRSWDGLEPDRSLMPHGTYSWSLTARNNDGRNARSAMGEFYLDTDFDPPFYDDDGTSYEVFVNALEADGITTGCAPYRYCLYRDMTRKEVAVFLARAMNLPPSPFDYFTDDEGSPYEPYINSIAHAGVSPGCGGDRFCPDRLMTRWMIAAFFVRALDLPESPTDHFLDDDGHRAEDFINAVAEAGISGGCGGGGSLYCPDDIVHRGSGAAFTARAFNLV